MKANRLITGTGRSESESHSVFSDSLQPHGVYNPWNSLGQNTGVGSLFPSPGDLPNPGFKSRSPTLQADSLPGEPQGNPYLCKLKFRSGAQLSPTLCDPMNHSTPGLPVHHQLLEFTQTHVHRVGDAIQPSHLLSSPSPPAPNPSQHQRLFQSVNSVHEVAKVLEFHI